MEDRIKTLRAIALLRIVRERLARRADGHVVESRIEKIESWLPLALRASLAEVSRDLVSAVYRVLDGAIREEAAFRPGRVFCHRCRGAGCQHSRPPSCREVFAPCLATAVHAS